MKKYQYGDKIDLSNLFGSNPLFSGFLKNANNFSDQFSSQLAPSVAAGALGEKPEVSSFKEFAQSKGFNPTNPLNVFKKGFFKLPKQYKEYSAQAKQDVVKYDQNFDSISQNIPALLGSLSMLMQGMKGQQQYDMYQANQPDLTETPSYQQGGSIEDMIQQDPWLNARGNIESSMNQDSTSHAGAVGMFQITPIALKEYNRKYDSKYTWDHIKTNAVANAHVSQGLIKDIRSMINKVDTNLSEFDKNILAEMAYNYGPYRFIDKLKAKGKNVTLLDMLSDKSLPTETRNHGKKFMDYFEKNKPLAGEKVLAPRDNTYVSKVDKLGTLAKFKGDPFEYKREGDDYFYRKGSGEFKPINEAGKKELQRRKFQYGGDIFNQLGNKNLLENLISLLSTKEDPASLRLKKKILTDIQINKLNEVFKQNTQPINYNLLGSQPSVAREGYIEIEQPTMSFLQENNVVENSILNNPQVKPNVLNTLPTNLLPINEFVRKLPLLNLPEVTKSTSQPKSNTIKKLPTIGNELYNHTDDELYSSFFDSKKHYVAAESDKTLLRSDIKRVYDKKTNNQVGYVNKEGQFHPLIRNKGTLKFEGRPSKYNISQAADYIMKHQYGGSNYGFNTETIYTNDPKIGAVFPVPLPESEYSKFNKDINLGRSFLQDWYSNRVKKYGLNDNSINYIKNTEVIPAGFEKNIYGIFHPNYKKVYIAPDNSTNTLTSVHELNHAAQYQDENLMKHVYDKIQPFLKENTEPNSFNTPDEIHSYMMEFRKAINKNPNIKWNMSDTLKIMKNPDLNPYLKKVLEGVKNNISLEHLMNSVVNNNNTSTSNAQMGGNINTTGYTPGTPTMENDHNIIPSNSITMEKTPFPVNAYPMNQNGELTGKPVTMKPGLNYYFPNASQVLEIPQKQVGGMVLSEGGFYRRKGDNWGYKQNEDGTFTVIDFNRNGKQFLLNDPNNTAYKAVAALFPNTQPVQNIAASIPQELSPRNSTSIQGRQIQFDTPIEQSVAQPQAASVSQLPSSNLNPYSQNSVPSQGISQQSLNQSRPLGFLDTHTALAGGISTGLALAPMGKVLAPVLGKLASLFGKKYISPNNYAKVIDDIFDNKVVPKHIVNRKAHRAYKEGSKKVFSGKSPIYEKYGGTVNKYQMGGEVQFAPIQTEKGERFVHPDLSISKTAAKKLHKSMDDDEITDIVPDGTFVGSRDPLMKISKKEAEQFTIANYPIKYESGKTPKLPKTIKFSDIFSKKHHTPSELLAKIDKKFKLYDDKYDPFVKAANQENLQSRKEYIDIVKYMTEVKKPTDISVYKYGGKVNQYQKGGIASAIGSLLPQLFTAINGTIQQGNTLRDISKYETDNRGYLQSQTNFGQLANLLGYASQDLTPEIYNPSQVLNEITNPYQRAINSIGSRQEQNMNLAKGASNDAYSRLVNIDPRMAYASASTVGANAYRNAAQSNLDLLNYKDQLSTQLGQQRANILRESLLNRQSTLANTRSSRNQLNAGLFGNAAQISNDYYSGLSNINNTGLAARMGARGQYANFLTNMGYGLSNSLGNLGSAISNLGKPTINLTPTAPNVNNVIGNNIGSQYVPQYTYPDPTVKLGTNLTGSYKWPF